MGSIQLLVFGILLSGSALSQSGPTITIYAQFEIERHAVVGRELERELTAAMSPVGVQFEWRQLDGSRPQDPVEELAVVKFTGRCAAQELSTSRERIGALGWTHISEGQLLPFSDIDCDSTWRLISPLLASESHYSQNRMLGRALGRILAHELYHILANTKKHASSGLAKACYTRDELTAHRFAFHQKDVELLRNGKLRGLLQRYARPPILTASGGE